MSKGSWVYAYAQAALDYASQHDQAEAWAKALAAMVSLSQEVGFKRLLHCPSMERSKLVGLLASCASSAIRPVVSVWLWQLVLHKRLTSLADIHEQFRMDYHRQQGQVAAQVISAKPLDVQRRQRLESRLSQDLGGQAVVASYQEDHRLIGGFKVIMGSTVIDATLRRRLDRVARRVTRAGTMGQASSVTSGA